MNALRSKLTRLSRFDRAVSASLALSVAAIFVTLAIGDNVGVRVERYSPSGEAAQTSWITVQFSEEMDRESVESRFSIRPEVPGDFSWSGSRMIFQPSARLDPGERYSAHIESGSRSVDGREALKDFGFSFGVRGARIAYLSLGDSGVNNVWITAVTGDGPPERLTFSESGVLDFAMSPDGRKLAYTEIDPANELDTATDLKVLDLETGVTSNLTGSVDSQASEPAWSADSTKIAYTRIDFSTSIPGVDEVPGATYSLPRVWVVDISQSPPSTERLLSSESGVSYDAKWSSSGDILAVGNDPLGEAGDRRIAVVNRGSGETFSLYTTRNTSASFNEAGDELVYIANTGRQFNDPTELWVAYVGSELVRKAQTGSEEPVRDDTVAWRPGDEWVAVARNGYGEAETRGSQPYLVNIVTGESRPIAFSVEHSVESLTWSPAGDFLAIVRIRRWEADGVTSTSDVYRELMVYNPETDELTTVTRGASEPAWAP